MSRYVLVVDDDPDAREVLGDIVESLGLEARMAHDGHVALEIVTESHPSLILLDLMMPRMDGFSTLARLRSSVATRVIPIIVVSACSLDQTGSLMLPGVTAVVQKGRVTVDGLSALISHTLGLKTKTSPAAEISLAVSSASHSTLEDHHVREE